jgi:CheY-like chemotaxis protein
MRKRKILLVDDNEISREMIRFILETRGWEVVTLSAPFLFVTTLAKEKPDLALIDLGLAALSGDQLVRLARMNGRVPCPLVLHADRPTDELRELVQRSGADGFIPKSGNGDQLVMNLEYFLRFGASRDTEPSSNRGSNDAPPPSSRRVGETTSRSEPSGPPTSRRLSGSFEAAAPPSSRRLSGSMEAVTPPPSGAASGPPVRRPGSGLYQAVVAALEIPPSSSKDLPPSSRRSGQHSAVSAPTPPSPPVREGAPPSRDSTPDKSSGRTKTLT